MADGKKEQSIFKAVLWIVAGIVALSIVKCPDRQRPDSLQSTSKPERATAAPVADGRAPSGEYTLKLGKDFNPGAAAIDDLGLSVLIAVDLSGSMRDQPASGGAPKYEQAREALRSVVSFLEGIAGGKDMKDMVLKVGVIGFSSAVGEFFPLTRMDKEGFAKLKAVLEDPELLRPSGNTAIGLALEKGASILASSGTILKSMIVISDGENTAGVRPDRVLRAINENWNDASTAEFPVSTRGILVSFIGFDVDAGIYGTLLTEGARLQMAADKRGLEQALRAIMVADISRLEAAPSP